jgi:hypothetical protein
MVVSLNCCRKYNARYISKPETSCTSWRGVETVYKGILMLCIATRVFNMKAKRRTGIGRASIVGKGIRGIIHVIVPLMVGCIMSDIVTAVRHWSRELLGFSSCDRASDFKCGRCCTVEKNKNLGEMQRGVVEQEASDDGGENCDARISFFFACWSSRRSQLSNSVGSFSCPMTRKAKAQSAALR